MKTQKLPTNTKLYQRSQKKLKARAYPALFAFLGSSLIIVLSFLKPISRSILDYDRKLGDYLLYLPGAHPPREDIVFLGIDAQSMSLDHIDPSEIESNETLKLMGDHFPWDRRVYVETIDRLMAAGAKLIIIDLLFNKESESEANQAFADAVNRHPEKIILAVF